MSFACALSKDISRLKMGFPTYLALGAVLALALATGCGDGDEDASLNCESESDQVAYVHAALKEYYLWNNEIPKVNLADYETPESLLDAVRYKDDRWSGIYPEPEMRAFYAGKSVGLGFRMLRTRDADGSERLRVALVYQDSPAMEAGLERGMTLLAINGKTIEQIDTEGLWGTIFGADDAGVEVNMLIGRVDGSEAELTASKAELLRTSVFLTEVVPVGDRRVGYVMFEQFIDPSRAALAEAFTKLRNENATDLVLDLRYNTGGLLDVTRYLASLIAGPAHVGDTFLRFDYNNRQKRLNQVMEFGDYAENIGFERVPFLIGGSTASASEALVNGLSPYVDVHLVGSNTLGKPVGSNGFRFCEKILQPITFALHNAEGEGEYFNGIAPDCSMDDDLDHQLGDPAESRFAAAISWLGGHACPDLVPNASGALGLPRVAQQRVKEELVRGPGVDGYYGIF